ELAPSDHRGENTSQAQKGRHGWGGRDVSRGPVAPFQGFADWCRSWVPRGLPWADMWLPRWGDGRNSQHQNWRFGLANARRAPAPRIALGSSNFSPLKKRGLTA